MVKKLLLVGFLLYLPVSVFAASYTVCDSGRGCNYTAIASAISSLTNGTANTITVKSPYSANERVTVNKAGASDSSRVVIIADTGYTPVTKGFSVTSNYVTVQGFEMTVCGSNVCASISADYVSFLNNKIHGSQGNNTNGIQAEMGTDGASGSVRNYCVFQGNNVYAQSSSYTAYQLVWFACNNALIDSNEIHDCIDCDGMYFFGHDSTISNNYTHDISYGTGGNHSDNFQTFGDCGDASCHNTYNVVIEKNLGISTGADLQPFNLSQDSQSGIHDITIRNNVFVNFGTQGNVGIPNMNIINNTFIDVGAINGFAINLLYGSGWNDTNLIIKNNIFLDNYSNGGAPFTPDVRTTHNNNYVVRWSGSSYYTQSGWSETGGVYGGNPHFTNYTLGTHTCGTYNFTNHTCTNFDLSLASNSPAVDTGADLSSIWSNATDIIGTTRPQGSAWDIGAYEYASGSSQYTLTVSKSGTGSGTVTSSPSGINCGSTCSDNYDSGTQVTLTAVPDSGNSFTGWSGSGCSGTGTCVVTMNAAESVTATFTTIPPSGNYALVVSKTGTGTGTVTSIPSGINCGSFCSAEYSSGTSVTLTATPDSNDIFSGWSGGSCTGTGTCTVTMNAAKTVTATFTLPPPSDHYNLVILKSGTGMGTVTSTPSGINCGATCSKEFATGTRVTLSASVPNSSHSFSGWSGGGCSGTGTCIVTLNADVSITVTFTSVTPPGSGSTTSAAGDGGGCFIATAAYGSYLDPHVMVLREFRDRILLKNKLGKKFVGFYYKHSPPVANSIIKYETLRIATRLALTPVIYILAYPNFTLILLLVSLLILVEARRKKTDKQSHAPDNYYFQTMPRKTIRRVL